MSRLTLGSVTVIGFSTGGSWDWWWDEEFDLGHYSDSQNWDDDDTDANDIVDDYMYALGVFRRGLEAVSNNVPMSASDKRQYERLIEAIKVVEAAKAAGEALTADSVHGALSAGLEYFLQNTSEWGLKLGMSALLATPGLTEPTPFGEIAGAVTGYVLTEAVLWGIHQTEFSGRVADLMADMILDSIIAVNEFMVEFSQIVHDYYEEYGDQLPSDFEEAFSDFLNDNFPDNPLADLILDDGPPADDTSTVPSVILTLDDLIQGFNGVSHPGQGDFDVLIPPLVIDLDGDGIELLSSSDSNMRINLDEDAALERLGWASNDDGVIIYDFDGDGVFSDLSEAALAELADHEGASDLDGLATLDSNDDGVLDATDFIDTEYSWESILVWQDSNGDGISTANEMYSLEELDIVSINLVSDEQRETIEGNQVLGRFAINHADGTVSEAGDVLFSGLSLALGGFNFGDGGSVVYNDSGLLAFFSSRDDDVLADSASDNYFVFELGDGNDTILDYSGHNVLMFHDTSGQNLFFGTNGSDLIISTIGTDDSVTINSFFNRIEDISIITDEGIIGYEELQLLIDSQSEYDHNNDGLMDAEYTSFADNVDAHSEVTEVWDSIWIV